MTQQYKSIAENFRHTAGNHPNKTALVYLGEKYSYAKLDALSDRLAGALYNRGVRQGDKVMIYAPHCPQWIITWLALQKMGAVAVAITHFYGSKELTYIANDCGVETIFCMDTNFGYVNKALPETSLKTVIVMGAVELLPIWKKLTGALLDRVPNGHFSLGENILSFKSLLAEKTVPPLALEFKGEEIAEILYTGGTTGFPKGVPISNAALVEGAFELRKARLGAIPLGEDVVIQGSPLYHAFGKVLALSCFFSGETLILMPKILLDAFFDHIERYKVRTIFGTPTMYRMMMDHDRFYQYNLKSLKYSLGAGDLVTREISDRWHKYIGIPISQGYGSTETVVVALCPTDRHVPEGASGRVLSCRQALVMDSIKMEPVPVNQPGELYVSSDHMVTGYWNKPEETARHFVTYNSRLWIRTGDFVRIDQDGWLYFLDRSADLIKHKGWRVASSKVDNVLQENPVVVESCTIGVPDPAVGERIKSYVVIKDDVKGITAKELIKWCRARLAPYEVPQYIEFRDMLPKSKVGKILRSELRAEERRKAEA